MLNFFSSLMGLKKTIIVLVFFGIIAFGALALKNEAGVKPFFSKGNTAKKSKISSSKELTADEAIKAVKNISKAKGVSKIIKAAAPISGKNKKRTTVYKVLTKESKLFQVDAKTGKVTQIDDPVELKDFMEERKEAADNATSTEEGDAVLKKAEDYMRTKYDKFDELKLVQTFYKHNVYVFFWQKVDTNGARLPVRASIAVNPATGKYSGFDLTENKTTISTKPKTSKSTAENYVKSIGSKEIKINECILYALDDFDAKQRLVWIVNYGEIGKSADSKANTYKTLAIDANTGKDVTRDFYF
jgi:hypothetical protein